MARRLLLLPLLALGCNGGLTVKTFVGAILQMTFAGAGVSAPGTHLELWTRNANNDIIRVDASYTFADPSDKSQTKTVYTNGLAIRAAVSIDDPCMIDGKGNLLTTADAYQDATIAGVKQTAAEQAQTFVNRIKQLTSTTVGGEEANTLLAVVPYDDTPEPTVAATATASERLATCQAYWNKSPLTYTGNPAQVTFPYHGTAYGFVAFTTTTPSAAYDGIRIDSPTNLAGTQELWLTTETAPLDMVDGNHEGPVYLEGKPDQGGQSVIHFDLTGPTASGAAAIYTTLDDGTVLF
jgi:hypothetical protein